MNADMPTGVWTVRVGVSTTRDERGGRGAVVLTARVGEDRMHEVE